MKFADILVLLFFSSSIGKIYAEKGCVLNLNEMSMLPIYVDESVRFGRNTERFYVLLPSEKITVICPDSYIENVPFKTSNLTLECINDDIFETFTPVGSTKPMKVSIYKIGCAKRGIIRVTKLGFCANDDTLYGISYFGGERYYECFRVCFNHRTEIASCSYNTVRNFDLGYRTKVPRVPYTNSEITNYSFDIYHPTLVEKTFAKILESEETAREYLKDDWHIIVPAQLTPKDDFIFGIDQLATFIDVNAIPMWKILRDGIWKILETKVREVTRRSSRYQVVTGTHGVLTLANIDKYNRMYLSSSRKLPIPKYIWKIIYDKKSDFGVVAIMVNNPFMKLIKTYDLINCQIIEGVRLFNFDDTKMIGFMYFCIMKDFLEEMGYEEFFYKTVNG